MPGQGSDRPVMTPARLRLLGSAVALTLAGPLAAQVPVTADPSEVRPPIDFAEPEVAPPVADAPLSDGQIEFAADRIEYDDGAQTVTASGQVRLLRDGNRLAADEVTWNRLTGEVTASGTVTGLSPGGDAIYGDRIVLDDSLRDGVVENLLLVLSDGSRLAANRGTRTGDLFRLEEARYTACPVTRADGCPRRPSWSLSAVQVVYDQARRRVRYRGARLSLFDTLSIPLPGLSHSVGGGSASGLLLPDVGISRNNGAEFSQPYYLRLAPNRDLTVTPFVYSDVLPMLRGEYRALTGTGAYRAAAWGTASRLIPLNQDGSVQSRNRFRGYGEANGRFILSPEWVVGGSLRRATDRTFLRRYDIDRDTRLRSTLLAERFGENSYLSVAGWATQELRTGFTQGQQPLALPALDGWLRLPGLGGSDAVTLRVNTLALLRPEGQDTARAFAEAKWERRGVTPLGQLVTLTGLARGDVYHTADIRLNPVASYRGTDGFSARGIALAAAEVQWPFAGPLANGTQRISPRVQLVATPPIDNLDIPNEDSRGFELEDVNIFSLNRFPGSDRFEDGARLTYGLDYEFRRPGFVVSSQVAQSVRLTDKPGLFPDGTGLTRNLSDVVGRTTVRWGDRVALTHRFRLDRDSFEVRRNEVDATVGSRQTYLTAGYLRLNRNLQLEDLVDREEVRVGGRVAIGRYLSAFGSAILDLTGPQEDPFSQTDGFQPIRHRLGILYDDECLALGLTWRRDYVRQGDNRAGNSFGLTVSLRNLGR